jgi:hypothetical protein
MVHEKPMAEDDGGALTARVGVEDVGSVEMCSRHGDNVVQFRDDPNQTAVEINGSKVRVRR